MKKTLTIALCALALAGCATKPPTQAQRVTRQVQNIWPHAAVAVRSQSEVFMIYKGKCYDVHFLPKEGSIYVDKMDVLQ